MVWVRCDGYGIHNHQKNWKNRNAASNSPDPRMTYIMVVFTAVKRTPQRRFEESWSFNQPRSQGPLTVGTRLSFNQFKRWWTWELPRERCRKCPDKPNFAPIKVVADSYLHLNPQRKCSFSWQNYGGNCLCIVHISSECYVLPFIFHIPLFIFNIRILKYIN